MITTLLLILLAILALIVLGISYCWPVLLVLVGIVIGFKIVGRLINKE